MASKIWGHRGASGYAPENTLSAFRLAAQMGAYGIELDVHFSKDRQVVVTHDDNVERVTNHKGNICDMTLEQLKKLDFSNHMAAFAGETIPTLEEVLQLVEPTAMHINIELKTNHQTPIGLEEAVQALVEKYNMQERILYSSFNHQSLQKIKEIAPHMPCGVLYSCKLVAPWTYAKMLGFEAVHPYFPALSLPDFHKQCKENDIMINVWTVNTKEDIEAMLDFGVDGIITNYPDVALALLKDFPKK